MIPLRPARFNKAIAQGRTVVLFKAEDCAPCDNMQPLIEEETPTGMKMYTFDITGDEAKDVRVSQRIGYVPRVVTYDNGTPTGTLFLEQTRESVKAFFEELSKKGRVPVRDTDAEAVSRFINRCIRLMKPRMQDMGREKFAMAMMDVSKKIIGSETEWYALDDNTLKERLEVELDAT